MMPSQLCHLISPLVCQDDITRRVNDELEKSRLPSNELLTKHVAFAEIYTKKVYSIQIVTHSLFSIMGPFCSKISPFPWNIAPCLVETF